jgi:hypothetical protein
MVAEKLSLPLNQLKDYINQHSMKTKSWFEFALFCHGRVERGVSRYAVSLGRESSKPLHYT